MLECQPHPTSGENHPKLKQMPNLVHITTCSLCDPQNPWKVSEEGFEVEPSALNGQVPQRLSEFTVRLLGHIQRGAQAEEKQVRKAIKHHAEHGGQPPDISGARHFHAWNEFLSVVALAQGFSILKGFETTDPALISMRDMARWKLHAMTRKYFLTDDMLTSGLVQLGLDEPDQNNVFALFQQTRDALLEIGQYEPKKPEEALVKL